MQNRRYIFIDYEDLVNVKFKKLEKICTRIFIFVHSEVPTVPMLLVQQMQRMGKDIRWISVENMDKETSLHMSFLMGKLHEKVSMDIEFAILSNEESFDPLVNFINETGRNCIRVKQKTNDAKKYPQDDEEEEELKIDLIEEKDINDDDDHYFMELDLEDEEDLKEEKDIDESYNIENVYQKQKTHDTIIPLEMPTELNRKTAVIAKIEKGKIAKY